MERVSGKAEARVDSVRGSTEAVTTMIYGSARTTTARA